MRFASYMAALFVVLFFINIIGCTESAGKTGTAPQSNAEVMEGLGKTITGADGSGAKSRSEDLTELKHWKHGRPGPTVEEESPVAIQFLTAKEVEGIVARLIDLGYLQERPKSEEEFKKAVFEFQKDHGIRSTGELDAKTIDLLSTGEKNY